MVRVPPRGYYLQDPTKSILVVSPKNVPREESYFRGVGLRVVTIIHCLDSFISDPAAETSWLKGKVQVWTASVEVMSGIAIQQPQIEYADWYQTALYTSVLVNTTKQMKKHPFYSARSSMNTSNKNE